MSGRKFLGFSPTFPTPGDPAPLKFLPAKSGPLCLLFLVLGIAAHAKPPTLERTGTPESEVRQGTPININVTYRQAAGDAPKSVKMIVQTPGGETLTVQPGTPPTGEATQGMDAGFTLRPENAGIYRYHFEATSETGESARLPATAADDFQFNSVSLVSKYVIFAIGLLVSLAFLPFVVYVAARSLNKRGNPAAAARIALLIGILASFGLFLYLFFTVYGALGSVIAATAALAFIIVLLTRK